MEEQLRSYPGTTLSMLMGSGIDALKLVSSLTLFRYVAQRLHAREPHDDYSAIARVADAILARAEEQGYPPCAHTLRRLAGRSG